MSYLARAAAVTAALSLATIGAMHASLEPGDFSGAKFDLVATVAGQAFVVDYGLTASDCLAELSNPPMIQDDSNHLVTGSARFACEVQR